MAKKKQVKDAVISEEEVKEEKKVEKVEEKEETKKKVEVEEVKGTKEKKKKEGFFKGLRKEMKQVVWPTAGNVVKSTVSVILICIFLCLFFEAVALLAAFIKGLFV